MEPSAPAGLERAPQRARRALPEVRFYPRRVDDPAPPAELTPSQAVHLAATPPAAAVTDRRVLRVPPPASTPAAPVPAPAPAAPAAPVAPVPAPSAPATPIAPVPAPAPATAEDGESLAAAPPPATPARARRPWWRRLVRLLLPGRSGRHAAP